MEKYGFLDGHSAQVLAGLHEIFTKAAAISEAEANDKEISAAELAWIGNIPNLFTAHILSVLGARSGGDSHSPCRTGLITSNGKLSCTATTPI